MTINFQEVWDLALEAHNVPADSATIPVDLNHFEHKLDRLIFNKDQPKQGPFMLYSPSKLVDLDSVAERSKYEGDAEAWTCVKRLGYGFFPPDGCRISIETSWCPVPSLEQWDDGEELCTGTESVQFARPKIQLFVMRDLPFLMVKVMAHWLTPEQVERFAVELPPDLNMKQWDNALLTDEDRAVGAERSRP